MADFLPLLGAFVVAGDNISEALPGFYLYNISDGIVARDIAPWFARWLKSESLTWSSTYLSVDMIQAPSHAMETIVSIAIGSLIVGAVLIVSVLVGDWWGFANAISMLISILVRNFMLRELRAGLHRDWTSVQNEPWATEMTKALVVMPGGEAITLYATRGMLTEVLLGEVKKPWPALYAAVRMVGWVGFGCHVVTIGMAYLLNQLISVAVLLLSTLLFVYGIKANKGLVANCVQIRRFDETKEPESRSRIYLRLDLTTAEEDSLITWGLIPQRSNENWWTRFRTRKAETGPTAFIAWCKASIKTRSVATSKKV